MILDNKYKSVILTSDGFKLLRYKDFVLYGFEYLLNKFGKENVDDIIYITTVNDDEIEFIKSYVSAFVKELRFIAKENNVALCNFCEAVISAHCVALSEYGILRSDWGKMGFWEFLVCRELQTKAIERNNNEVNKKWRAK